MQILVLLSALSLFGGGVLFAQTADRIDVSGTVVDRNGEPVVGASVVVIGTMKGTITDADGAFYLSSVAKDATLSADLLGYKTVSLQLSGRSRVNIILEDDALALEESVVVGYGQMKKSDLTGSVASVKPEKLTDIPANSIDGLLQGRVAGVQVINSSQDPGASSTIRIRGNSSLNGSNAPLVVIDGFPYGDAGDLKQINPQDIVSMEVLKDASASAIYGSRGANGVILITTRKAKENNTKIIVRQQTTLSQFSSKLNLWRDPVLMAMISNESNINAGLTPTYIGAVNANGVYYPSIEELKTTWTTNTRWDDIVFRDVPVSDNTTVQVQSSNDRTTFLASANYYRDNGMYIKDYYQKYGGNFSVEHKIYDNLRMKASANLTRNKRNNNNGLSYSRNPIFPVYDENGEYWQYSVQDYYHPLALTNLQKNVSTGLDLISFVSLSWDVLDCLNLSAQLNYKHGESTTDQYFPKKYSERGTFNDGYGSINNWKDDNVVADIYATFDKTFGGKHHLTAMAGYSYENYQSRSSFLASKGYVNESLGNENLASGNPETYSISNGAYKTELVSGMIRLNYAFDNRYLLTFTARADGSSKFGKDNKWAFFPSGAFSWKINEESFLEDAKWLDVLKIRASYGISGNQGISAYQTLSRYGQHKYFHNGAWVTAIGPGYQSGYAGQGGIYAVWSGIPNTGLKWETTSQVDVGLDFSAFGNRLNVTFDWYDKVTDDLLRERNIAPSSGYDKMWVNDGKIRNRGIELTVDGVFFRNRDWNVGGTFVFSRNRNEVLSLGNALEAGLNTDKRTGMQFEYYGNSMEQFRSYTNILAVGQPMYVFYGYQVNGMVQSLAEGLEAGLSGDDALPGEFKYMDIYNEDGMATINEDDRCIIGDPNPDWTASLALNASWKNLDLSLFFNGVFGNDVLNTKRFDQPDNSPLRWTEDNPTDKYPRLNANRQTKLSDWWIEDGSFVRLQTVTLGYTLPFRKNDTSKSVRLYVSGDNVFTFSKFGGYDPEVGILGIYYGGYPRLRKWTIGVDFTF
ncbi:MAG: TonB-dependent receptor [Bacteroidales bacterium]|nr:TonB-dependent receptor [Bacteroidales bacterium]MDY5442766.1 TonB-dependent receptor [Candidatus Cryptobacteroides sp.]